nr:oligosaccharide flippase family protein [Bacteroidales bacterium]
MAINVRREAASGAKWNFIGRFGHYGLQFVVSVILARLLMPEEFGLVGMMTVFMGIATVFIDSGLSAAIIQKKNATSTDFSTVFYYNLAISTLFYLILFFGSGYIAEFYKEPELRHLT